MSLQGGLGIERMCLLAGISRAGFYRHLRAQDPWEEEMAVRSEVQRIALEHQGRYGYRRITAELRRQGMAYVRECLTWDAKAQSTSRILQWAVKQGLKPDFPPPKRLQPMSIGGS